MATHFQGLFAKAKDEIKKVNLDEGVKNISAEAKKLGAEAASVVKDFAKDIQGPLADKQHRLDEYLKKDNEPIKT